MRVVLDLTPDCAAVRIRTSACTVRQARADVSVREFRELIDGPTAGIRESCRCKMAAALLVMHIFVSVLNQGKSCNFLVPCQFAGR